MEHPAVAGLLDAVLSVRWVTDVWLSGSLASGDHRPGVSDIDVVAVTSRQTAPGDVSTIRSIHARLDAGVARGAALGCAYVFQDVLDDVPARHPTWTHGRMVRRHLSPIARAELLQLGRPLVGRSPAELLRPMDAVEVAAAARAELTGYWAWAVRRPWLFLRPSMADLALVSMARIRHASDTGELISKSDAIPAIRAPASVVAEVRRRREAPGRPAPLHAGQGRHAWIDARRTVSELGW